eukprot:CCRYP_016930-RA/>CCRYP_016930-RA protein AED:0.29 eAED:0.23 QI:0/0/0/1/0/0/2/0/396
MENAYGKERPDPKGMYGLPQAGIIAQQLLEKGWPLKGYRQSSITPGFWKHDWRPISFTLCVDDFVSNMLASNMHITFYKLSTNTTKRHKTGRVRDTGLTIAWDYTLQQVQLSMPGYCKSRPPSPHPVPIKPQHQPYPHTPALTEPNNSLSTLLMIQRYSPTPTKPSSRKSLESSYTTTSCGLHHATCAGVLATQQSAPTQNTITPVPRLCHDTPRRHDNLSLQQHDPGPQRRPIYRKQSTQPGWGHFSYEKTIRPRNNGAILTLAQIIKPVMSSAAEAELGALYINARETIPQRHLLNELGHPQPPTPIQIDNSTALEWSLTSSNPNAPKQWTCVFIGSVVEKIKTVSHLLAPRGTTNLADYVTKHHPAIHHQAVRHIYLPHLRNFSTYDTRHTTY